jgi:hypothetical protein
MELSIASVTNFDILVICRRWALDHGVVVTYQRHTSHKAEKKRLE